MFNSMKMIFPKSNLICTLLLEIVLQQGKNTILLLGTLAEINQIILKIYSIHILLTLTTLILSSQKTEL